MSSDASIDRPLDRRFLIRGGAVLAGAAGASVIGAALAPTKADAADGDNLTLGEANEATSTTSIRIDGTAGGTDAALSLRNADGPSLALQALSQEWDGPLKVGEIVNTDAGPSIGVDYGDGAVTTFLATGVDLANLYPVPAERLLDTRSATSRADQVVNASSASPFDSIGRLKGGAYIDIAVAPVEDLDLIGVYLNVTAYRPTEGGYLEVYTPGTRPQIPTVPYKRLVTVANSTFVAPGVFNDESYTVRVFAQKATQVQLDLLGAVVGFAPTTSTAAVAAAPSRRVQRQAKLRARLVTSVKNR